MQRTWGYISAWLAFACACATGISLAFGLEAVALILSFGTATIGACVLLTYKQPSPTTTFSRLQPTEASKKLVAKPTESIAHAIEHNQVATEEEVANVESAESAKEIDVHRDDESGLLSSTFFPVYLEQRITAARRTLRPVSLVTFELDGLDKNDSGKTSDTNFFISAVGDVVKRTLRESDCAFRIDENTFAAVMDDTTESGAVWAAERVRGVLHTGALAGRVTVSAGVACYPSHALESEELIACSAKALESARARGVDQVEIAAEQ